ncbi:MAG: hypothetical protein AB1489_40240 [Acidobacteriota bacterium]
MFEQVNEKNEDKGKKRLIIVSSVVLVLLTIGGMLLYSSFSRHQQSAGEAGLTGALRTGVLEYDNYAKEVIISNQEFYYAINALGGRQIIAKGRVQNFGNKMIKGLEIRAVAYDFDGKPIGERLAAPIPRASKDPLEPNGSLPISVVIDNAPDEDLVQDIKLELHGLILQ